MFYDPALETPDLVMNEGPARSSAGGTVSLAGLDTPAIDSESAALFRAWLRPLLEGAQSWTALRDCLETRGYGLAIRAGRLVLIRHDSGQALCTLRFVGTSLGELVARLGRPTVRALPGQDACGDFIAAPHH